MASTHHELIEIDPPAGLESVCADEIRATAAHSVAIDIRIGCIRLHGTAPDTVAALRTAYRSWLVVAYDGTRPSVICGDDRVSRAVRTVAARAAAPPSGVRITAPGASSPRMRRVRSHIADTAALRETADGIPVRIRRAPTGWEVLVRIAAAADAGAGLNAAVAAALMRLTRPGPDDRFLDLCCGTGTIGAERILAAPARRVVAVDVDARAVREAVHRCGPGVDVLHADARDLPMARASMTAIVANPPWGHRFGSHESNEAGYPPMLTEAARVAVRGARMVALTTELSLMQRTLGRLSALWSLEQMLRVDHAGVRPGVFVLRRR